MHKTQKSAAQIQIKAHAAISIRDANFIRGQLKHSLDECLRNDLGYEGGQTDRETVSRSRSTHQELVDKLTGRPGSNALWARSLANHRRQLAGVFERFALAVATAEAQAKAHPKAA